MLLLLIAYLWSTINFNHKFFLICGNISLTEILFLIFPIEINSLLYIINKFLIYQYPYDFGNYKLKLNYLEFLKFN